jgi:hypothetical protein
VTTVGARAGLMLILGIRKGAQMRGLVSIAIGALSLALAGCSEDVRLERRTVTYPNGKGVKEDWTFTRKPNGDTLEHGVHKKFFWNGNPSESVIWKMGKRDGSAQAWYDNGAAKWQKSYDNGEKQGTWRLFYLGGQPWIVVNYSQDKLDGKAQVWSRDGGDPKEAEFGQGNCKSGECGLLDLPEIPVADPADSTATAAKVEATRVREILKEFLDQ